MIAHTEAIVLKSMDFRETSRIVTFFTKEYGKMKGVLKGIRSDPGKFGSSVDIFSVNDIIYYRYSRSEIHLVSKCDLKQFFFPIRQDYGRNIAAHYALELINAVMPTEEENKKVYALLIDYLTSLETVKDIHKLIYFYQIKMLHLSGFSPHLDSCVKCNRRVKGTARFSVHLGGLVCPRCPTTEASFMVISHGTISSILHAEESEWGHCIRLGLTKKVRQELKYILNNFLVYHLERELKTAKYLNSPEVLS